MDTKHTPGPWSRKWVHGAIRHINKNVDEDAFYDAELDPPNVRIHPADAGIIAAAPLMLEALCGLLTEAGTRGFGPDDESVFYCEFCDASHEDCDRILHHPGCPVVMARAAIAKATGTGTGGAT